MNDAIPASSSASSPSSALDVDAIRKPMQELHDSAVNFHFAWRQEQLLRLRSMLMDHWDDWIQALKIDLGKSTVEAVATELLMVRTDLDYTLRHLSSWMQPKKIPSPVICFPAFSHIEYRPLLGPAVLILGPSNYPLSLTLHPAVGALAAGNPVVLKPSELAPTVSQRLSQWVPHYFPPPVMVCIANGGIPETTALLQYSWGRIFFTGSATVGTIVATAAAHTLTPVTLELGGKSPCYIDEETTNIHNPHLLRQIAQRIIWSKTLNAGQTCAATDTLIATEKVVAALLPHLVESLTTMFGANPEVDSELGRIVTVRHAERLVALLQQVEEITTADDDHRCQWIVGGSKQCRPSQRYICPTILINPPAESRLMQEEIFGPILPIVTVPHRAAAVEYIRHRMPGTPLCLYVFTDDAAVFQTLVRQVPAGSVVRNDCLVHLCSPYIPFGGLGTSGYGGTYHGRYTFDLFSHALPVLHRPYVWPGLWDWTVLRCHPFTRLKRFVTVRVAIQLPAIPVLHVRFFYRMGRILLLLLLLLLLSVMVNLPLGTSSLPDLQTGLANVLEQIARHVMHLAQNCRPPTARGLDDEL
jgi:acyl-CoA reductase-like NAD-dependent aldehyde dehydrogenase